MFDLILNILKLAGVAIGGAAGLLGTIRETKTPGGKLTSAGKWLLRLGIGGFVIALAAQAIEWYSQQQASRAAAEDTKQVLGRLERQSTLASESLRAINRTLTKFDTIEATVSLRVPFADPAFAAYRERIEAVAKDVPSRLAADASVDGPGYYVSFMLEETDGLFRPRNIVIPVDSPLFPKPDMAAIPRAYCARVFPKFAFFRGEGPAVFDPSSSLDPDLQFGVREAGYDLTYDLADRTLEIRLSRMKSDLHENWCMTGQIVSLEDLRGCHLFIYFEAPYNCEPNTAATVRTLQNATVINDVWLQIAGRALLLKQGLERQRASDGSTVWSYRFPSVQSDFDKATSPVPRGEAPSQRALVISRVDGVEARVLGSGGDRSRGGNSSH